MKEIKALIVDDEELARKNLSILIEQHCPSVTVAGEAASAADARKFLKATR